VRREVWGKLQVKGFQVPGSGFQVLGYCKICLPTEIGARGKVFLEIY
jgi:hypothetical protein